MSRHSSPKKSRWLSKLVGGGRPRPQVGLSRLRFEPLEDRRLLSVFTVINTLDGPVANPGDLPGSLRQAIFDANRHQGADQIQFSLPAGPNVIALTAGELAITDSLTITGLGASNLAIDGPGNVPVTDRIFDIPAPIGRNAKAVDVTISGLTLADGFADSTAPGGSKGGAIYDAGGSLTIQNDVFGTSVAFPGLGGNQAVGLPRPRRRPVLRAATPSAAPSTMLAPTLATSIRILAGFSAGLATIRRADSLTVTGTTFTGNIAQGGAARPVPTIP